MPMSRVVKVRSEAGQLTNFVTGPSFTEITLSPYKKEIIPAIINAIPNSWLMRDLTLPPNDQVKGRRHAVPESEANDLNRLLGDLRCANSEVVKLRFEADCTVE
jgi:hypothetical protein